MTKSTFQTRASIATPARDETANSKTPADVLARGWIAAIGRLNPASGDSLDARATLRIAEHWTVETVLKLGFVAPDRAYEVGLRVLELSDDPWILENVGIGVFDVLRRRGDDDFRRRLAQDTHRLPRLRQALSNVADLATGTTAIR